MIRQPPTTVRSRPAHPWLVLATLGLLSNVSAIAAQWTASPSFSWSADDNDNRRLDFVKRPSRALQLSGAAELRAAMETLDISVTPSVRFSRYDGDSALNSTDVGLALSANKIGEVSRFNFQASESRDSTLTSELRDTGIIEGRQQRETVAVGLGATHVFSPTIMLTGAAGWQRIRYDNAAASGLVDYRYPYASAALSWQTSALWRLSLRAEGTQLEAPTIGLTSRNQSLRMLADWRPSERLSFGLAFGESATKARRASDRGLIYSASLKWSGLLTEVSVTAGRDVAPTGRGVLVTRDEASMSVSRQLSPRLALGANASFNRNEDLLFGILRNNRRYWSADSSLSWRVTETCTLTGKLSLGRAAIDLPSLTANSRGASLLVSWTPKPWTLSR